MSGEPPDDPTRKLRDELLAQARTQPGSPHKSPEPLPPPVWDEPEDEVPTLVELSPLPKATAATQATALEVALQPLRVHPQPPALGEEPYADTAIRPAAGAPAEPITANTEVPEPEFFDADEPEDATVVLPLVTPAAAQVVVPAGVARNRGKR